MDSPRVSIIIPAYNYEDYVHQAVSSALNQSHTNIEIIAVDDGSSDRTPEILGGFTPQITFLQHTNSGLAATRNLGIKHATGDYLFFLDADDFLAPDAIERMLAKITESPGYVMVAASYANVSHQGDRLHNEPPLKVESREVSLRELLLKNRFSPAVLVDSKTLKQLGGFDQDFGRAEMGSEDRDLWIRIATTGRVYMIAERLVFKRQHASNMSSNPERQTASMRRTIRKCREKAVVPRRDFIFWSQVQAVYHYQAGLMYRETGRKTHALFEFLLSLLRCPFPCPHKQAGLQPLFRSRALLVTLLSFLKP